MRSDLYAVKRHDRRLRPARAARASAAHGCYADRVGEVLRREFDLPETQAQLTTILVSLPQFRALADGLSQ